MLLKSGPELGCFCMDHVQTLLGFRKSDIDVYLAEGDTDLDKSEILLKLADILKSDNLENVQALIRARVPIVKLMDPVTGISCDICVNNLLSVINTKLLHDYSKIDVGNWPSLSNIGRNHEGLMKHIKGPYLAMRELTTLFFYIAGGSKMGNLCNGSKGVTLFTGGNGQIWT